MTRVASRGDPTFDPELLQEIFLGRRAPELFQTVPNLARI